IDPSLLRGKDGRPSEDRRWVGSADGDLDVLLGNDSVELHLEVEPGPGEDLGPVHRIDGERGYRRGTDQPAADTQSTRETTHAHDVRPGFGARVDSGTQARVALQLPTVAPVG